MRSQVEALYADLEQLGKIFRVDEKATEVVDGSKKRVEEVEGRAPQGDPVPVFLYDSGTDQPFTAGTQVPPNEIIKTAGGRNVFDGLDERWTQVDWESDAVADAEPEVVVILDCGDLAAERNIDGLEKFATYLRGLKR